MRITVIVPSYNSSANIGPCLRSLLAQTRVPDQIMVVDSSKDNTPEIIAQEFPEVRLVRSEVQLPSGDARQVGVETADTELIAFIDTDCVAEPRWIEEMLAVYAANPELKGVTGVFRGPADENVYAAIDRIIEFSHLFSRHGGEIVLQPAQFCLSIKREALLAIGGIPRGLYGNSDRIWCTRFQETYGPFTVAPKARVVHRGRNRLEGLISHQHRLGHCYVAGRRYDPSSPGSIFLRQRWLIPFIPLVRGALITSRLVRYSPRDLGIILGHPILFARGLVAWTKGVYEASGGAAAVEWERPDAWSKG